MLLIFVRLMLKADATPLGLKTKCFDTQGSSPSAATLGYGMQPLRGKDILKRPRWRNGSPAAILVAQFKL